MNPALILQLVKQAKDYKDQIDQEAQQWDQDHNIHAPKAKVIAKIGVGLKVVLSAMVFGEFPLDLFPGLEEMSDKLGTMGFLSVGAVAVGGMTFFSSEAEKEEKRVSAHGKVMSQLNKETAGRKKKERLRRQESDYLPDF